MATFPESSPTPNYPLIVTPRWDTIVSKMDGGAEQRRQKTLFPVYDVKVVYDALSNSEARTLWNFFMARRGRYEAFYIYDMALLAGSAFDHDGQFVGSGDGVTDTFDLPGRSTSSQTIYVDGAAQTLTTHYTISAGTGVSGADQVVFVTAPTDGTVITADFTGFLRMRVRFAEDTLSREIFMTTLSRIGITLTGVTEYAT
jgi:hypothetical protein